MGLDTELAGPTIPEGLSPDCQDVAFTPGNVFTRPAFQKYFASSFGSIGVTYNKSFLQPNGDPLNLFLTSDGNMHVEDVLNNPGTTSVAFSVIPNLYASSVTAFGREYFTFHDGFRGRDIPRQYDGENWYRITQDPPSPGSAFASSDAPTTTIPIVNIVPKAQVTITTATLGDGFVTVVTSTNHGLAVGDNVLITGVDVYQYNGQAQVATVPTNTSFTYNSLATGLTVGHGGSVIPDTVTVTTTINHGLISGETITISGNSDNNYNNSQQVSSGIVGLAPGAVCRFWATPHAWGGSVQYWYPGDGPTQPPAPAATFTLNTHEGLFFNPNGNPAGTQLPGAPSSWSTAPMKVFGVNASGNWDGTSRQIWSGSHENWTMSVVFNLTFSAAGTYYFKTVHDDGALIGMGGGISAVSGPMNDPDPGMSSLHHHKTITNGLPIVYSNDASTDYAHVSIFNDAFVVSVPAAGTYPCEIDYSNWETKQTVCLLYSQDAGVTYKAILPGNIAFATPATWNVKTVTGSKTFTFDAVYAVGTGTGGIITVGGLGAPGVHQAVVMFQTEADAITAPSPPISFVSAGNKRYQVTGLPIGPPNVKARIVAFTGAGGSRYFYIPVPATDPSSGQTVSTSTVVNDNTSTTATFDFSDNTLYSSNSIPIDVTGNNLFEQVVLGPCANIFSYSNRLFVWGDTNKIQNLKCMGFEGGLATVGATLPLGWDTSANAGGALTTGDFGYGWRITGNGTATNRGLISQAAFEDNLHNPILQPNTQYTFECFAYSSNNGGPGSIKADLYSATGGGVLATATIAVSTLGVGSAHASFVSGDFDHKTPLVVPEDTVLRVYAFNLSNGQTVTLDELMMVYTDEPFVPGQLRVSYALNPEGFDGLTGIITIPYPESVMQSQLVRDNMYILSDQHLCRTQDNGAGEPITWSIYTVSEKAGGLSLRSFDTGEGWGVFAAESGLYAFFGGEPQKISQEVQTLWTAIDPNRWGDVWVKNDQVNRRIYVGIPLTAYSPTGTTFTPSSANKILVLDYRELNSAQAIEAAPPLHISMTGRMLTSDLTRKWTVWNIPANCGEMMYVNFGAPQIMFGGGLGTGLAHGYGNSYTLDVNQFVDDDYGQIGSLNGESPLSYAQWLLSGPTFHDHPLGTRPTSGIWRPRAAYYMAYFSPSHEQEQALQVGSERHLYEYLQLYAIGTGDLHVLPHLNRAGNPVNKVPGTRALSNDQNYDLEWKLYARAQRMALLFYATPSSTPIPPVVTVTISPTTASISTFATQQFTATCNGPLDNSVVWTCDAGSITQDGLYTAPGLAGTYHVTVTSNDDPTKHATATVTVTGGYDGA